MLAKAPEGTCDLRPLVRPLHNLHHGRPRSIGVQGHPIDGCEDVASLHPGEARFFLRLNGGSILCLSPRGIEDKDAGLRLFLGRQAAQIAHHGLAPAGQLQVGLLPCCLSLALVRGPLHRLKRLGRLRPQHDRLWSFDVRFGLWGLRCWYRRKSRCPGQLPYPGCRRHKGVVLREGLPGPLFGVAVQVLLIGRTAAGLHLLQAGRVRGELAHVHPPFLAPCAAHKTEGQKACHGKQHDPGQNAGQGPCPICLLVLGQGLHARAFPDAGRLRPVQPILPVLSAFEGGGPCCGHREARSAA